MIVSTARHRAAWPAPKGPKERRHSGVNVKRPKPFVFESDEQALGRLSVQVPVGVVVPPVAVGVKTITEPTVAVPLGAIVAVNLVVAGVPKVVVMYGAAVLT